MALPYLSFFIGCGNAPDFFYGNPGESFFPEKRASTKEENGMGFVELLLVAVGLSMDAFAVSVCKGLSTRRLRPAHYWIIGAWFGGFRR